MKQLLVIIDGLNFDASQLDAVQYIARISKGQVTIALLEYVPPAFPALPPIVGDALFYSEEAPSRHMQERMDQIRANTEQLRAACTERGLSIGLRTYTENMLEALVDASRFADLMLVGHHLSLSAISDSAPSGFIRDLMARAQCPLLIMPATMQVIREIFFTYNGSYSSMYAIRSFLQLFSLPATRKVTVLYVAEKGQDSLPNEVMLRQYLAAYCKHLEYRVLEGHASNAIMICLQFKKHALVTFGAYGRSGLSRYFNGSTADEALALQHPWVFVTHP